MGVVPIFPGGKLVSVPNFRLDLLVIYIDGMVFADHCVIASVGVDRTGAKHVLGVVEGAT